MKLEKHKISLNKKDIEVEVAFLDKKDAKEFAKLYKKSLDYSVK